ncbi:ubiquitin carboxyl-terminal hydrolase faf-y-related [Anaeramoeba flamelloides]|uniref:ubiquitinyl hydrolase 1 n=1 Tax=Anaeramoeba flamelloides TaxID=1746091 RepID=A0AAV7ZW05_9EUKA|nr:ubiquitin carboxyl-terminal hydrolase faf-y-related [Anaeramoeba flamelloides]
MNTSNMGYQKKKFKIDIDANDTVLTLKNKVSELIDKKLDEFRISSTKNWNLDQCDEETLTQAGLIDGTKINVSNVYKSTMTTTYGDTNNYHSNYYNEYSNDNTNNNNSYVKKKDNDLIPTYLLSQYFDDLLHLLENGNQIIVKKIWDLLLQMPSNVELFNKFSNLFSKIENNNEKDMTIDNGSDSDNDRDNDQNNHNNNNDDDDDYVQENEEKKLVINKKETIDWDNLLNSKSLYKLVYSAQIISNLVQKSQENNNNWIENFIKFGGVEHLILVLINVYKKNEKRPIKKKAMSVLLNLIFKMIVIEYHDKNNEKKLENIFNNGNDNDENKEDDEEDEMDKLNFKLNEQVKLNKISELEFLEMLMEMVLTSSKDRDKTFIQENVKVITNSMRLIEAGAESRGKKWIKHIVEFSNFENWLKETLIDSLFEEVSMKVIKGLYRICLKDLETSEKLLTVLIDIFFEYQDIFEKSGITIENDNDIDELEKDQEKQKEKLIKKIIHNEKEMEIEMEENDKINDQNKEVKGEEEIGEVGSFLELLSLLINLIFQNNKEKNFNFNKIFEESVEILIKRPIIEQGSSELDQSDNTLIGLMKILVILCKNDPIYREKSNELNLIEFLFNDCLFTIQINNDEKEKEKENTGKEKEKENIEKENIEKENKMNEGNKMIEVKEKEKEINYEGPKCKTEKSFKMVYLLLLELIKDNPDNFLKLARLLYKFQNEIEIPPKKKTEKKQSYHYQMRKSKVDYIGLVNLGATCYMNSLLQQLFHTPEFRKSLLMIEEKLIDDENNNQQSMGTKNDKDDQNGIGTKEKKTDNLNFYFELQNIFGELWKGNGFGVNTRKFCKSFTDWDGKPINPSVQEDCYEFLNRLFSKIEEHLKEKEEKKLFKRYIYRQDFWTNYCLRIWLYI